ncbi:glycine cleavage system protein GcvH [Blattabacterium cuenoti]|uniref:glycine cleavage system protein GcvH n=1 Tax=Blattabacterium cuenoti TaxID=1653831 RepID=UPI00163CF702|nr:glycine cleavage system protein GcvH [Blattabacterium cuenoti]
MKEIIKYSKNHEWIKLIEQESLYAYIGISLFAQKELGDIIYLDIDKKIISDQNIKAGEIFGSIEAVKTVSDLFMPVSGKIIDINNNVLLSPDLVNKDPYNKGWILKIKILDIKEYNKLMSLEEYKQYINK